MIETKVWGTTTKIFSNNNVEIHRLEIVEGGYCSKHYHDFKYNGFYCESGCLEVQVWRPDSDLIDTTVLTSGTYTTVEPKVYHKFLASKASIVYEIYWVELINNDIVRESFGGLKVDK